MFRKHLIALATAAFVFIYVFVFTSEPKAIAEQQAMPATARLSLTPCNPANIDGEARCGKYDVYENRTGKTGRKISLKVVVLRALSATPAPDPVFWLHGGPGAAATDIVPGARGGFLEALRKNRDIVFVDQRGTGGSNPLKCDIGDNPADIQKFFGELFPIEKIKECREKLEKIADLRLYTTPIAMDDLDEVRDALGYDKINLVGGSYGTIAAQVYMRQHPEHLRTVFLGGVANTNIRQPLPFAKGAQQAINRLFEDCSADKVCSSAFPNLRREFDEVIARFDKGAVTAELINPATKQKQSVSIMRASFVEKLRMFLYTTTNARFVPLIIHKAFENDYIPFEELALANNLGGLMARGMYLTVTCSESVPFITEQDIKKETKETFVGDYRVRVHIKACKEWVKGDIPKSYINPVKSKIPVLMVSGELDASTPPWLGAEVLKYFSNGRQINIRYYGHQIDTPCVWKLLSEFVNKGSAQSLDATCTEEIRRPPFATEMPGQFVLR